LHMHLLQGLLHRLDRAAGRLNQCPPLSQITAQPPDLVRWPQGATPQAIGMQFLR
jgi:hypothetical protein